MVSFPPSTIANFTAVLSQTAAAFHDKTINRPNAEQVVDALLQAEKIAKQQRLTYAFEQLDGEWQLWFATGTRKARQGGIGLKKGYYVPKIASVQISFAAESGAIGNQVQLGLLQLQLTGPARYQEKKNLLAFDFTRLQFLVGKTSLYAGAIRGGEEKEQLFKQTQIAKLPFFAFFLITDTFIAARGRGGGLALWVKEPLA